MAENKRKKSNNTLLIILTVAVFAIVGLGFYLGIDYLGKSVSADAKVTNPVTTTEKPEEKTTEPPTTEPDLSTPDTKIQLAGDVLLHAKPVSGAKKGDGTYDFKPYFSIIKDFVDGDLSVFNMEGPVDVKGGNKKISYYPQFNSPYEILTAVKDAGFNFAVTANNHTYDQHFDGLVATRNNIKKAGLNFTGTNETQEQYDTYNIQEINGIKIGVIAYSALDNGMSGVIPKDKRGFAMRMFTSDPTSEDMDKMIADIQGCKKAGAEFVILSLHWGVEYVDTPPKGFDKIAKKLCDGGADIIMGNHSHCVQPIEKYTASREDGKKETLIIYSMGNFFADQITLGKLKTQCSMLVNVNIHKNKDGVIEFGECSYIPTYTYRFVNSDGKYDFRLLPVGKYIDGETRPDVFKTDADWKKAKQAWEHVTEVVGDAISAVK